jgi:hypothetical protein
MVAGLVLFGIGAARARTGASRLARNALWMAPWFAGLILLGALGSYGDASTGDRGYDVMPHWIDLLVVIGFSLGIFYLALHLTLTRETSATEVAKDAQQLDYEMPPVAVAAFRKP